MNKFGNSCFILVCFISTAAFAAAPQGDKDLSITLSDCQMLAEYQPSADVAYKPGVDVNGKPVASADLTPSVVDTPKKISFDLNANYAGQLGMTLPAGSQGMATIGKVSVDTATGEVTWNGKPVEGDAMAALKAACAAKAAKKPSDNQPAAPK